MFPNQLIYTHFRVSKEAGTRVMIGFEQPGLPFFALIGSPYQSDPSIGPINSCHTGIRRGPAPGRNIYGLAFLYLSLSTCSCSIVVGCAFIPGFHVSRAAAAVTLSGLKLFI